MDTPDANKLTREELYELVWTTPLTTLAKNYNISDNGLRKICIKLAIPLPKSGYWSKIKFNKPVKKIPLPKNQEVNQEIKLEIRDENVFIEEHFQTAFNRLKKEIETNYKIPNKTLEKLIKPHPLIKAAKEDLKNYKHPNGWMFKENIRYTSPNILNIEVSKESVFKALCFMDAFIKLIEKRKHSIQINGYHSEVIIFEERITIKCREILKRMKIKKEHFGYISERNELVPSGMIAFEMGRSYWKREWRETSKQPLETKLPNIIASLELNAKRLKEERIESEKWHIEYEKNQKIEEEQKRLFEKEINDFKTLKINAKRWKDSTDLFNYINAIETNAINTNTLTEELKIYIKWAKDKADWYNPIIQKEDDIFNNLDPNKF